MTEDGKKTLFEEPAWNSMMSFQLKLNALILSKAKAILFVPDPKSGFRSLRRIKSGNCRLYRFKNES